MTADLPPAGAAPATARTKALLACGAVAGPLFVTVFLVLGALRPAYDPLRHSISTLALGEFGWIQRLNFLAAGVLTLAFAVGARRILQPEQGSFWGPALIGLWAVGLLGAGTFVTDPTAGYPPGTPAKIPDPSVHGILHNLAAGLGFPALVAACLVLARRFATHRQRGWALYSAASGAVVLVATVLASYGFPRTEGLGRFGGLFQRTAVVFGWGWLSALAILLLRSSGPPRLLAARRAVNTKTLLACGAIAGPLFTLAWVVEGATRAHYHPLRHPVSSLELGDLGWAQQANFVVAGGLTLAFAVGLRRGLRPLGGSTWGPLLVGAHAIGLLGAGIFVTDPVSGYPPGTPDHLQAYGSVHAALHDLFSVGTFVGLPLASLVMARRFAGWGQRGWATYSAATGLVFVAGFVLASMAFNQVESLVAFGGLFQRATITLGWTWLTLLAVHLLRGLPQPPASRPT